MLIIPFALAFPPLSLALLYGLVLLYFFLITTSFFLFVCCREFEQGSLLDSSYSSGNRISAKETIPSDWDQRTTTWISDYAWQREKRNKSYFPMENWSSSYAPVWKRMRVSFRTQKKISLRERAEWQAAMRTEEEEEEIYLSLSRWRAMKFNYSDQFSSRLISVIWRCSRLFSFQLSVVSVRLDETFLVLVVSAQKWTRENIEKRASGGLFFSSTTIC